jgi:hypothetical protein
VPHCEGLSPIDGVIPHTFEAFPTWCNQKLRFALSSEAYTSKPPHPNGLQSNVLSARFR